MISTLLNISDLGRPADLTQFMELGFSSWLPGFILRFEKSLKYSLTVSHELKEPNVNVILPNSVSLKQHLILRFKENAHLSEMKSPSPCLYHAKVVEINPDSSEMKAIVANPWSINRKSVPPSRRWAL